MEVELYFRGRNKNSSSANPGEMEWVLLFLHIMDLVQNSVWFAKAVLLNGCIHGPICEIETFLLQSSDSNAWECALTSCQYRWVKNAIPYIMIGSNGIATI
jgi:hypothetical protein